MKKGRELFVIMFLVMFLTSVYGSECIDGVMSEFVSVSLDGTKENIDLVRDKFVDDFGIAEPDEETLIFPYFSSVNSLTIREYCRRVFSTNPLYLDKTLFQVDSLDCNDPTDFCESAAYGGSTGYGGDVTGFLLCGDSEGDVTCSISYDCVEEHCDFLGKSITCGITYWESCGDGLNFWRDMNGDIANNVDLNDYVRVDSVSDPPYDVSSPDGNILIEQKYWQAGFEGAFDLSTDGSKILNVNSLEEDDRMNISISSPNCGDYFDLNDDLIVSFNINDSDDYVFGNILINEEEVFLFNNSKKRDYDFVYDLSALLEGGSYPVVISMNNTRGKEFRSVRNIMVYDSGDSEVQYYVAACIDKPINFVGINSSHVEFEATSTRAIKYDSGVSEIDDDDLVFTWNFWYRGRTTPDVCSSLGSRDCNGKDDSGWDVTNFFRRFPTIGGNKATLSVSIPAGAM